MKLRNLFILAAMTVASAVSAQNVTIKLQGQAPKIYPASSVEFIKFDDSSSPQGDVYNILTPEIMPDAALREAIMDRLDLEEEYCTNEQAANYQGWLMFPSYEFVNCKGLEYFTSATYLCFDNCKDIDTTTIPVMPNITSFSITFCSLEPFDIFSHFPNLTKLVISGNHFKNYAPVNDKLQILYCDNNYMETLDLSGCPNLYELTASTNKLTSVNIGSGPYKEIVVKDNPSIGSINFDHCRNSLWFMNVSNTGITSLDLHDCVALEELECQGNQFTETPNFSGCSALKKLRIEESGITSLDLSGMPILEELNCYSNKITNLDLSNHTALWFVNAFSNPMTSVNVDGCTALYRLHLSGTKLPKVDLSNCSGDNLFQFYCEQNPDLKEVKVWEGFDLDTPPSNWFIQSGAKYVYEFTNGEGGGGEQGGDDPDPNEGKHTVSFSFTNPGTEDCVFLTANFEKVDQSMTVPFILEDGITVAVVQNYSYVIDEVKMNGETISWAGAKYFTLTEDVEFVVTAHVAPKVSTTVNIDNANAIDFAIEGENVTLVDGNNTVEFFERKNSATITTKPGYKITSLKIGGWGYWFEETGETEISLEEGDTVEITTATIE